MHAARLASALLLAALLTGCSGMGPGQRYSQWKYDRYVRKSIAAKEKRQGEYRQARQRQQAEAIESEPEASGPESYRVSY